MSAQPQMPTQSPRRDSRATLKQAEDAYFKFMETFDRETATPYQIRKRNRLTTALTEAEALDRKPKETR